MFTGIIETLGTIKSLRNAQGNLVMEISSDISQDLKVDQSLSHNGVCLTVTRVGEGIHEVEVVRESLMRTSLQYLEEGDLVNLERCLPANGRFDGHMVQGHVDQTGKITDINDIGGSKEFTFSYFSAPEGLIVEKGSVALDGISLTAYSVMEEGFKVSVIPYTLDHTNLGDKLVGDLVNIEFDILGKYIHQAVQKMPKT